MRRSLSLRIATLVFVVFATTAPAFASGKRDDSPMNPVDRIVRVFKQIVRTILPLDVPLAGDPKP